MKLEDKLRSLLLAYELPMLVHASIDDAADELEDLRKDSERYRWLRNVGTVKGVIDWNALDWEFHDLPAMDSAIDAAMKDKP